MEHNMHGHHEMKHGMAEDQHVEHHEHMMEDFKRRFYVSLILGLEREFRLMVVGVERLGKDSYL